MKSTPGADAMRGTYPADSDRISLLRRFGTHHLSVSQVLISN